MSSLQNFHQLFQVPLVSILSVPQLFLQLQDFIFVELLLFFEAGSHFDLFNSANFLFRLEQGPQSCNFSTLTPNLFLIRLLQLNLFFFYPTECRFIFPFHQMHPCPPLHVLGRTGFFHISKTIYIVMGDKHVCLQCKNFSLLGSNSSVCFLQLAGEAELVTAKLSHFFQKVIVHRLYVPNYVRFIHRIKSCRAVNLLSYICPSSISPSSLDNFNHVSQKAIFVFPKSISFLDLLCRVDFSREDTRTRIHSPLTCNFSGSTMPKEPSGFVHCNTSSKITLNSLDYCNHVPITAPFNPRPEQCLS
mmetsp:Transcript_20809/g.42737  ORF Transcript_20809/g.42737 Transcript_20809/m.42737 type:complete len:303 (-) Transcript_20809:45-953(-)